MQPRNIINRLFRFGADKRARIGSLPVMNATIEDAEDGMLRISLVDWPAVESDFLTFHKDAKKEAAPAMYRVMNEERRIVFGVVMRADFPIYRYDSHNGEFFIVFTKETIRKMAEKYLADGRQNQVNVMHLAGSDVEGVQMVQFFIKDKAAGIDPEGFEVIEDGSLFAEFHVTNDEVWDACKNGTYRGFSIEVLTGLEDAPAADFAAQLAAIANNPNTDIMFKLNKIKELAAKIAAKFKSVTTDKGILEWDGDSDAEVGQKVFVPGEGEGAERQPAPDGDYKLEDGTVYTVADGEITEIKAAEGGDPEPGNDPDPDNHEDQDPAGNDDHEARIAALEDENRELREEIEGLEDVIETIINNLKDLGVTVAGFKKPAADPAHKRFAEDKKDTKVKGYARLSQILSAK